MLTDLSYLDRITDFDREVFRRYLPPYEPLVAMQQAIDWEAFRPLVEAAYCPNLGQPAICPIRMLKLEFLRYLFNLSDSQVTRRSETDVAFRYFLQVGFGYRAPDASTLCYFRARLGEDRFVQIFDQLVSQARRAGLVKDRLRLKDASHVVANIAVPTTLTLVAEIRDRLLSDIGPFDPDWVAGQRIETRLVRERTKDQSIASRLSARVTHLQELLAWAETLPVPADCETNVMTGKAWHTFQNTLKLAQKILQDRKPKANHKTLSVQDPDARRGKHGEYFDGYLVDILMDADSNLITQINVLPAGGEEARDAIELVRAEQTAHGNQIEGLSIDGAGFHGPMLRELEGPAQAPPAEPETKAAEADGAHEQANGDEHGLGVTVYVPAKTEAGDSRFPSSEFIVSDDGTSVTCPAGKTSDYHQRNPGRHASIFRFARTTCEGCPLRDKCVAPNGTGAFGRSLTKNDYEPEYERARKRTQTPDYAAVRREHPSVERKLNEILNHHRGRRARYWGRPKIHIQELMTAFVVNVKQMMASALALRAAATKMC